MLHPAPFIIPAQPALRDRPPKGDGWLHEVKFDGYRVQLHKHGKDVAIYSRNGINFASRFPAIAYALAHLPTKSAIIDAEAVACNAKGMPDFVALHGRGAKPEDICSWAFDLLQHNSLDTSPLPLMVRRARLEKILERFDNGFIRFSETFSDAERLLAECERHGIEGIVSKRKDAPYRSGKCDWVKVKRRHGGRRTGNAASCLARAVNNCNGGCVAPTPCYALIIGKLQCKEDNQDPRGLFQRIKTLPSP